MISCERDKLLSHPLCQSILSQKWYKMCHNIYTKLNIYTFLSTLLELFHVKLLFDVLQGKVWTFYILHKPVYVPRLFVFPNDVCDLNGQLVTSWNFIMYSSHSPDISQWNCNRGWSFLKRSLLHITCYSAWCSCLNIIILIVYYFFLDT